MTQAKSIDQQEIDKFAAMADEWWDIAGKFKPLHKFNPVRIGFIRDQLITHFKLAGGAAPLSGLKLLDIGCGGGLLSEPMARLGATVTSIDASEKNIRIADAHAQKSGLAIDYRCTSAESLAQSGEQFDVVLNMEVIEHVADVASFMQASCQLVKPGGLMIMATLNRTVKSYALAIIGAEYVLGWLPKGTHDWKRFLKPSEIDAVVSPHGMKIQKILGVSYSPIADEWRLSGDIGVNYMLVMEST